MSSLCGINCDKCELSCKCNGCSETNGQPFGANCLTAIYLQKGKDKLSKFKEKLINAFNELNIPDMEKVTDLNNLIGSFVNLEYLLPNNQLVSFWDDNKIYFGSQLHKSNSDRCYGIVAEFAYSDVMKDLNNIKSKFGPFLDYYESMHLIKREAVSSTLNIKNIKITFIPIATNEAVSVFVFETNGKKLIFAPCDCVPFPDHMVLNDADVLILGNTFVGDVLKMENTLPKTIRYEKRYIV